jgi:hypothetical protein
MILCTHSQWRMKNMCLNSQQQATTSQTLKRISSQIYSVQRFGVLRILLFKVFTTAYEKRIISFLNLLKCPTPFLKQLISCLLATNDSFVNTQELLFIIPSNILLPESVKKNMKQNVHNMLSFGTTCIRFDNMGEVNFLV